MRWFKEGAGKKNGEIRKIAQFALYPVTIGDHKVFFEWYIQRQAWNSNDYSPDGGWWRNVGKELMEHDS